MQAEARAGGSPESCFVLTLQEYSDSVALGKQQPSYLSSGGNNAVCSFSERIGKH